MITNFLCYNQQGKITKVGQIEEDVVSLQVGEGENYLLATADFNTQYVEKGIIVDMPEKPYGEYVFNYDTKQWEFDAVTADLKAKQKRDKLLAEGPDRISPMWWSSMTTQEQMAWTQYRQDLLDITGQADYPEFIVWPIKP